MAGSRYPLDSAKEVGFGGLVVASILFTEILYFASVCGTQVLPDDFLGDIPTDVLPVVARFLALGLLFLGFEDFWAGGVLVLVRRVVREYERTFSIGGWPYEVSKDGVVGLLSGKPVDGLEELLL